MILQQFALPTGRLGSVIGAYMARGNARLAHRVVDALELSGDESVLEIGYGPGVGLLRLAERLPRGRVYGIDPSPVMRTQAAARIRHVAERVELAEGTAQTLPWPAEAFNAVCSVNSVQLWQPREPSLKQVLDSLVPGGRLALGVSERAVLPAGHFAGRTYDGELCPALEEAGFTQVAATWYKDSTRWQLLVLARKP